MTSVTAFAPASVGNVAVGFDVLGHALDALGDRVTLERIAEPTVKIGDIGGAEHALPRDPTANTATAGLLQLIAERGLPFGFEVSIEKGVPLGSGMGGSAASAVAAMVAASAFLPVPLTAPELLAYALVGEEVASGSFHGDNLAACLLGGLVLVRSLAPPDLVSVPVPEVVRCVVVLPQLRLDTRSARAVLPPAVPRHAYVEQSANLAGFLAGCFAGDVGLIGRSLVDGLVEPHRQLLVPGFCAVKRAALEAGALGCSLSGSGPSVFAWCEGEPSACEVRDRMIAAFAVEGIPARGWVSRVGSSLGARILEVV